MFSHSLAKANRLKKRSEIQEVFLKGRSVKAYPLILKFVESDSLEPFRMGVTVPKRKIRSAVHRNFIKRRIRESYRMRRPEWENNLRSDSPNRHLAFMIIYADHKKRSFEEIDKAMKKLFEKAQQL